jgi:hypothetical protein
MGDENTLGKVLTRLGIVIYWAVCLLASLMFLVGLREVLIAGGDRYKNEVTWVVIVPGLVGLIGGIIKFSCCQGGNRVVHLTSRARIRRASGKCRTRSHSRTGSGAERHAVSAIAVQLD